jgi:hypothetical protein
LSLVANSLPEAFFGQTTLSTIYFNFDKPVAHVIWILSITQVCYFSSVQALYTGQEETTSRQLAR